MSKASEYAKLYLKWNEARKIQAPEPEKFWIHWPGGGGQIGSVNHNGHLALEDRCPLEPEQAIALADWIYLTFGEGPT